MQAVRLFRQAQASASCYDTFGRGLTRSAAVSTAFNQLSTRWLSSKPSPISYSELTVGTFPSLDSV